MKKKYFISEKSNALHYFDKSLVKIHLNSDFLHSNDMIFNFNLITHFFNLKYSSALDVCECVALYL